MAADPDCIFCKIVGEELPATRVAEDDRTVTFMDINPATRGHVLIVSREHTRDLLDIDHEDLAAVAGAAQKIARVMPELPWTPGPGDRDEIAEAAHALEG